VPKRPEPWLIHFFQRHPDDDPVMAVPATDFLRSLPVKVAAELQAILDAVAKAPPPSFSGGGKWEAMHGDMAGLYEARVSAGRFNYRLFCLLVRAPSERLGGPSIVCLAGLSKRVRSAAAARDYTLIRQYADEFARHQTVAR
jgi:Txe/YoeB family toxin of Txe-Axe toxin-antitoxin module